MVNEFNNTTDLNQWIAVDVFTWVNGADTPLNARNLNKLNSAITAVTNVVSSLTTPDSAPTDYNIQYAVRSGTAETSTYAKFARGDDDYDIGRQFSLLDACILDNPLYTRTTLSDLMSDNDYLITRKYIDGRLENLPDSKTVQYNDNSKFECIRVPCTVVDNTIELPVYDFTSDTPDCQLKFGKERGIWIQRGGQSVDSVSSYVTIKEAGDNNCYTLSVTTENNSATVEIPSGKVVEIVNMLKSTVDQLEVAAGVRSVKQYNPDDNTYSIIVNAGSELILNKDIVIANDRVGFKYDTLAGWTFCQRYASHEHAGVVSIDENAGLSVTNGLLKCTAYDFISVEPNKLIFNSNGADNKEFIINVVDVEQLAGIQLDVDCKLRLNDLFNKLINVEKFVQTTTYTEDYCSLVEQFGNYVDTSSIDNRLPTCGYVHDYIDQKIATLEDRLSKLEAALTLTSVENET